MIIFRSWLKLIWLSMELDEAPSAQISRNLEKILSVLNFLALKTGFPTLCVAPRGACL